MRFLACSTRPVAMGAVGAGVLAGAILFAPVPSAQADPAPAPPSSCTVAASCVDGNASTSVGRPQPRVARRLAVRLPIRLGLLPLRLGRRALR
ncbi:MAG: hypothetical protein ACRDTV_12540 [Mycobacterium sp.]